MTLDYFVHDAAICESTAIGGGTRIWAFVHVLSGARIGRDCNVCDGVFIENDVVVGDRVTIKSGVQLWDGLRVGDDVFIGPNATFTNDRFPRSRQHPARFLETHLRSGASVGANATVLPGVTIGRRAMIAAGAVVTDDVPAMAKVVGNPGRIVGYVDDDRIKRSAAPPDAPDEADLPGGARVVGLPKHRDLRGALVAGELDELLPFTPRRVFVVFEVPGRDVRGEHAHRECAQFLLCVTGSVRVHLDDGRRGAEVELDAPTRGLLVPPMVWASQFHYSPDAALVVLASHSYDPDDYLRDYEAYLRETTRTGASP